MGAKRAGSARVEEQIVIVDPGSRKITAVLQRGLDASSSKR